MPEEQKEKRCVIYFKMGWLQNGHFFGHRFDRLDTCCEGFEKTFFQTGNPKNPSWNVNTFLDEKPGLSLLLRSGERSLLLGGQKIFSCPWCGQAIEIKKSRDVSVQPKMKEVPDGYEEIDLPEGWDA